MKRDEENRSTAQTLKRKVLMRQQRKSKDGKGYASLVPRFQWRTSSKGEGRLAGSQRVAFLVARRWDSWPGSCWVHLVQAGRFRGFEPLLDNGASVSGGEMKGLDRGDRAVAHGQRAVGDGCDDERILFS